MQIFIDESGDAGFKFERNSSRFFIVAIVLVENPAPLVATLEEQRLALGRPEGAEFKFARMGRNDRLRVLRALATRGLVARALVVNKQRLVTPDVRSREGFYQYVVREALKIDFADIVRARLVIDQSFRSKAKQADLATYLRRSLNTADAARVQRINDIAYRRSHREPLLQVADLVAGAIARSYEDPKEQQYRRLIESCITVLEMP